MKKKLFECLSRFTLLGDKLYSGYVLYDDGTYCTENELLPEGIENIQERELSIQPGEIIEEEIFTSKELAAEIESIINSNVARLKSFPDEIANPFMLNSNENFIRFKDKTVFGYGILAQLPYEKVTSSIIRDNAPNLDKYEEQLIYITNLYLKITDVIEKYK